MVEISRLNQIGFSEAQSSLFQATVVHQVVSILNDVVMKLWASFKETIHLQAQLGLDNHLRRERINQTIVAQERTSQINSVINI